MRWKIDLLIKKTLDELGSEEMAKNLTGYEEHGLFVKTAALKNQLTADKRDGSDGEKLDEGAREKLMTILVFEENPEGSLKDIIGLSEAQSVLVQQWSLPLKFPNFFTGNRRPWESILLYGLAGTGKTTLAKAFAGEIGARFISVIGHKLRSDKLGESENAIMDLFTLAKEKSPTILLIDEIEGLFPNYGRGDHELTARICTEFFEQVSLLRSSPKSVIILGATNDASRMDAIALNKFEKLVYMELPGFGERTQLFKQNMADSEHRLSHTDFDALARKTDGYTGGDILKVIRNARMKPLTEVATAFNFKKIDSSNMNNGVKYFWTPCDTRDGSGMQMTWKDIPNSEDLVIPKLTLIRMTQAILRVKPASTGISMDKIANFRSGLMNEFVIHEPEDRDASFNHLRENRKWYDCFLECFVG